MGPAEGYVWRAYETASGKIQERKSTKLFKVPKKIVKKSKNSKKVSKSAQIALVETSREEFLF